MHNTIDGSMEKTQLLKFLHILSPTLNRDDFEQEVLKA
jgi:hypothetical protein